MPRTFLALAAAALLLGGSTGCDRKDAAGAATPQPHAGDHDDHDPHTAGPAVTNRIDLPPKVRDNLGITFAKVERRRVAATIRVPGRFEPIASARREYRAALPGRVEVLVKHLQRVEPGAVLFRIDSPEWQRTRLGLSEAAGAVEKARAAVLVAERAKTQAERDVAAIRQRVDALAELQTRKVELEIEMAKTANAIPKLDAEIAARAADLHEAEHHLPLLMAAAASAAGVTAARLTEDVDDGQGRRVPRWRTMDLIEVRAADAGVVESFAATNGAWVEQAAAVVSVVDPAALRFRATALQSDLARLKDGAAASIVPPAGAARANAAEPLAGKVAVGVDASAEARTVDLIVTPDAPVSAGWPRAGVTAYAEVVTDDSVDRETAIPTAAVVQDELAKIYFRRDPKDPDKVIRVEGDFGVSDGRWVVVESGLKAGDEVVVDGVYELKLTGGGKTQGKGHFHADGTWHEAGTPEPGAKR